MFSCCSSKKLLKVFSLIPIPHHLGSVQAEGGLGVLHPLLGAYLSPRCFALLLIASFMSFQHTFTRAQGEVSACSPELKHWNRKPQNILFCCGIPTPASPMGTAVLPPAAVPAHRGSSGCSVLSPRAQLGEAASIPSALHGTDTTPARGSPAVTPPCQLSPASSRDGFLNSSVFINRDVCLHHWGQAPSRAEVPAARWELG